MDVEFVYEKREKFCEKVMGVGALSRRGTVPLIKVPQKVKINSDYSIEHVLKPFLENEVPIRYLVETDKGFVYHDLTSSHTSHKTTQYANELQKHLGKTLVSKSELPATSLNLSHLDF